MALLSIGIIDSFGNLSCRYYFLRFNFTPHIIWTLRHSCHLAVYKLKMEGKIKYFHSKTCLGLTETVKSKINISKRKLVNDHDTECCSKKKSKRNIFNDHYRPVQIWGYINAFGTTTFALFSFLKESSCMELESMQIIYVIWHMWQRPKEIAQRTDISSLNACKFNNIFDRGTR